MLSELATPMYVPALPDPEFLQLKCLNGQVAQNIFSPPADPKLQHFPPGLLWVPGQLLRATAGGYYLNRPIQVPLGAAADVMRIIPPDSDAKKIGGCSDVAAVDQTSVMSSKPELSDRDDCADLEATLESVLRAILAKDQLTQKGGGGGDGKALRWWACPEPPLLCPLTGFPVCLLPYPPFKLRADAKYARPHRLVDGKFLALCMIAKDVRHACGRQLQASDIGAIDDYFYRCKLGALRPGRAAALEKEAREATDPAQQAKARQDLDGMVTLARAELGKLCRIQENRLLQINKMLPVHAQAALKHVRNSLLAKIYETSSAEVSMISPACKRGRRSSSTRMSTEAVTSSGSSEASQE